MALSSDQCNISITQTLMSVRCLCEQMCNNTIGGYDCSCQEGYQLLEGTGQCEGMYQEIEPAVTVVTIVPLL